MYNTIKNVCLYFFIIEAILLFLTLPDAIITWVNEHYILVWGIYTLTWFGYLLCDRRHD